MTIFAAAVVPEFEVGMLVQNTPERAEHFGEACGRIVEFGEATDGRRYTITLHRSEEADWYLGDDEWCTATRFIDGLVAVARAHCDCGNPIYVIDYLCENCRG